MTVTKAGNVNAAAVVAAVDVVVSVRVKRLIQVHRQAMAEPYSMGLR